MMGTYSAEGSDCDNGDGENDNEPDDWAGLVGTQ